MVVALRAPAPDRASVTRPATVPVAASRGRPRRREREAGATNQARGGGTFAASADRASFSCAAPVGGDGLFGWNPGGGAFTPACGGGRPRENIRRAGEYHNGVPLPADWLRRSGARGILAACAPHHLFPSGSPYGASESPASPAHQRRRAPDDSRSDSVWRVYQELRQLIVSGQLPPGARIAERVVADRLGLSRTPVRSALHRLQQEGFVDSYGRGRDQRLVVAPLTQDDGREIMLIVGHLEGLAARSAAQLSSARRSQVVRRLRELNRRHGRRVTQAGHRQPDLRPRPGLSQRLRRGRDRPRLLALHSAIKPQVERYSRLYISSLVDELPTSVREHEAIIRAIAAGDPVAAQHAVETNWRNAAGRLTRVIAEHGERGIWHAWDAEGPVPAQRRRALAASLAAACPAVLCRRFWCTNTVDHEPSAVFLFAPSDDPLPSLAGRRCARAPRCWPSRPALARPRRRRAAGFDSIDVQIPMRDGIRLHTRVFTPKAATAPLPLLLTRTPYGIAGAAGTFAGSYAELAARGLHLRLPGHPRPLQVRGAVRDAPATPRQARSQGDRREHRHLRHDRVAAQERAAQQRPGRHAGRVLSRLAHRHGDARPASGAQGGVAAGLAGRHVPGRRLPSQRRLPAELRLRVRHDDGGVQGVLAVRVRPARHLQLVPLAGRARWRQRRTSATCRASIRPGTISWPTRTTTPSGSARRSCRTSTA